MGTPIKMSAANLIHVAALRGLAAFCREENQRIITESQGLDQFLLGKAQAHEDIADLIEKMLENNYEQSIRQDAES